MKIKIANHNKDSKSGYKGINWHTQWGGWHVIIQYQKKRHTKYFKELVPAIKWYNQMAKKLHGEFAYLNPLPQQYRRIVWYIERDGRAVIETRSTYE